MAKILIVEDDKFLRELMVRKLSQENFRKKNKRGNSRYGFA